MNDSDFFGLVSLETAFFCHFHLASQQHRQYLRDGGEDWQRTLADCTRSLWPQGHLINQAKALLGQWPGSGQASLFTVVTALSYCNGQQQWLLQCGWQAKAINNTPASRQTLLCWHDLIYTDYYTVIVAITSISPCIMLLVMTFTRLCFPIGSFAARN